MFNFTYDNRDYENWTAEMILEKGFPQSVIDNAVKEQRKAAIKAECRGRIYGVASAETQMNMATAVSVISAKSLNSRSNEENAVLAGVAASLTWVGEMRAATSVLNSNPDADITDDANWPECPAEVLAVVEQF